MPTQRFPLAPGGVKRLSVTTGPFVFSKATIRLDGKPLLQQLTAKQLGTGVDAMLPDGSRLFVKRVAKGLFKSDESGLEVTCNGIALPGSIGTPEHALRIAKEAGTLLYALAGLNALFGAFVQVSGKDIVSVQNNDGWPYFASALLLAILGHFVHRRLSLPALGIAMAYLVVDGFAGAVIQSEATGRTSVGGVVMRVFFAIFLFGAFKVIRRYKAAHPSA